VASLILFQSGKSCRDPHLNCEFDPWANHIWDMLVQVREWSKTIDIYFIVDVDIDEIPENHRFKSLNVKAVHVNSIPPTRNLSCISAYDGQTNLTKTSLVRFFYIESLMKTYGIDQVFTFDNDIMVYHDLSDLANRLNKLSNDICLTPHSPEEMVCGMMWIPSLEKLSKMNDMLIDAIHAGWAKTEMRLLKEISNILPIVELPIWIDGKLSFMSDSLYGIFDPSSIGQYLGGTHNGHPPLTVHPPQFLAEPLASNNYSFLVVVDNQGRRYYLVSSNKTGAKMKIHSLHIHSKKLKGFMSRA
jgi:hypothetical protein